MKPESLLGITVELLEDLSSVGRLPADARVGRFFRARRYLGSRDRRVIGDMAYAWLRHRLRAVARWDTWAARREAPSSETLASWHPRLSRLAETLVLAADGLFPWNSEETLDAAARLQPIEGYGNDTPWETVLQLLTESFVEDSDWPSDPMERLAAEVSLPQWAFERLRCERGEEEAVALGRALLERAPVDLRVNLRRTDRAAARDSISSQAKVKVEFTPTSPLGLRLEGRCNLTGSAASRKGWIEVADEGSQLVALCLEPEPQHVVLDACAGAGGKTLALADIMLQGVFPGTKVKGKLYACDTSRGKLQELMRRAADVELEDWIIAYEIDSQGPLPDDIPAADLVLADAPCSGLGTLRRNPDLKDRYAEADVEEFARLQLSILERCAAKVKVGGRLAYVTCSVLEAENERVVEAFGAAHPEFCEVPSAWAQTRLPMRCFFGNRIHLDPLRSGTDGFFLVQWERSE